MAVSLTSIQCPACGAGLSVETEKDFCFCSYCGSKIMITNDNVHIYRNIDEARIKEAETQRMVMMREMEIEEKHSISQKYLVIVWLASTAILTILGIIGFSISNNGLEMCLMIAMLVGIYGGLGLFSNKNKKNRRKYAGPDEVRISESMAGCSTKNYNGVVMLFKSAGFTNVNAVPLGDLNMFTMMKNGQVETVTINGTDEFDEGDVFPKSAGVLITYHSK